MADPTEIGALHAQADAPQELFRLMVESVRDYAIFLLDPSGHVASWNTGAQRLEQYTSDEIIGRHFSRFYLEEDALAGKCQRELEVAARDGRFEDEGWRVRKDGTRFWANVILSAVRDAEGTLLGFSKVIRDLTERKLAEEERAAERQRVMVEQAAREVAERASRAKDEFLAMLGHELRNPMAPILTALQLMKLRGDVRSSREQEVIERQVNHMVRLVDDLLDVSRITSGKVELQKRRAEARELVAKAVELAAPILEQRRHHFDVHVPELVSALDVDGARIVQVLTNVLNNAAKYTEPGGHVSLTVREADGWVYFEVRDDGIGIEPALLPQVFDLFIQGHQGTERASGGLGLGLALVRSLVALHGGTVEAHSPGRGKGSAFVVALPIATEEARRSSAPTTPLVLAVTTVPRRVLVVDDNDDARFLLAEALTSVGHDVRAAGDPAEALELIASFAPEVAILDIGLPVMDGYELAVRLRSQLPVTPKLIALTGYGQPHDRERSRVAGFDVHLVKPVDLMTLLDLVNELGVDTGPTTTTP